MTICVYGSASNDIAPAYLRAGEALGRAMAARGHALVYGAGKEGMMGAVARGMTEKSGTVIGIAPRFFIPAGVLNDACTRLIYTDTMRERKQQMEDESDAFIVTPGGIGTYEEFFEILTLKQLARHNKPIALFNIDGYYDTMETLLRQTIDGHFMKPECRTLYELFTDIDAMLSYLESYDPAAHDVRHMKNL